MKMTIEQIMDFVKSVDVLVPFVEDAIQLNRDATKNMDEPERTKTSEELFTVQSHLNCVKNVARMLSKAEVNVKG